MRLLIWIVLAGVPSSGLLAQKLETQPSDTKKVVRVETAADHLTVIEAAEPVTMVAVGNQGAFTVERRENKVFIKPVEEGATTNLFVWTTAGRFAYELVPASSVEQMHFVIDQQSAPSLRRPACRRRCLRRRSRSCSPVSAIRRVALRSHCAISTGSEIVSICAMLSSIILPTTTCPPALRRGS